MQTLKVFLVPWTMGPILSNFPALVQPQCNPKVREQMFPLPCGGLCECSACPTENWIGLGPKSNQLTALP